MSHYEPNDSPFGDAFRAFVQDPDNLRVYGPEDLDEFASVICSLLNTPAYEDDGNLHRMLARITGLDQSPDDVAFGYAWGEDRR